MPPKGGKEGWILQHVSKLVPVLANVGNSTASEGQVQVACSSSCFVKCQVQRMPALGKCCFWGLCGVKTPNDQTGISPVVLMAMPECLRLAYGQIT